MKVRIEDLQVDINFKDHQIIVAGIPISINKTESDLLKQMVATNLDIPQSIRVQMKPLAKVKLPESDLLETNASLEAKSVTYKKRKSQHMFAIWAKREGRADKGLCAYCDKPKMQDKLLCKQHLARLNKKKKKS